MPKKRLVANIGWAAFGLIIMFYSNRLGIGGFHEPGPGLTPFLSALALLVISGCFIVESLWNWSRTGEPAKKEGDHVRLGNILFVLGCLFAYALLLRTVGFLIVAFLFLFLLFWKMGSKRWSSALVVSLLTVFITYFVFRYLGVYFPEGILESVLR